MTANALDKGKPPVPSDPDVVDPDARGEQVWQEEAEKVRLADRDLESPSLTMLVMLATLGVLLYASFLFRPSNIGDALPWAIVVLCETVMMFQVLISLWTQLSSAHDPRGFAFHAAQRNLFIPQRPRGARAAVAPADGYEDFAADAMQLDNRPISVDVYITTYGEPVDIIRRTVAAAVAIRGEHRTWILDDGRSPEVERLAAELGANYLTRPDNKGAKAGNINHALSVTTVTSS